MRKKQLVQAIAWTVERSKQAAAKARKDRAAAAGKAKEQSFRAGDEPATRRKAQQSHMAKQRKMKQAHQLASLEKKLEYKLGVDGMRWLEDYVEAEVAKEFAAELAKARERNLLLSRRV